MASVKRLTGRMRNFFAFTFSTRGNFTYLGYYLQASQGYGTWTIW